MDCGSGLAWPMEFEKTGYGEEWPGWLWDEVARSVFFE